MAQRASSYTREVADQICERLALGETLREICRGEGMPKAPLVLYWVDKNFDGLAERYARARDRQMEHWADELMSISDDSANDYMERNGKVELNSEHVQRSRLRSDNRKWLLSKLKPGKYGDKIALGGDPENPMKMITQISYVIVDPKEPGGSG